MSNKLIFIVIVIVIVIIRPHLEKASVNLSIYKIYDYEWYEFINVIFKKIDRCDLSRLHEDVQCDAVAIRELCESRDSCNDLMFDHSELHMYLH